MSLERAIEIAVIAHKGQVDRAGAPYVLHPLRMMLRMQTDQEKIIAVLHDVIEDTAWTFDDLRNEGFSEEIIAAVDCLTRREDESYDDFVRRTSVNALARRVKVADLEDNMDIRRYGTLHEKDLSRLQRYLKAWHLLTQPADAM